MGITISHETALRVTRMLRSQGLNLAQMDRTSLASPTPWVGKRWTMRLFSPDTWQWPQPDSVRKLDVLVGSSQERLRMDGVANHVCATELPADSIIWLDEHTGVPAPPLLFAQMAEKATLPALVLLGHELCGHFCRWANNPARGPVTDGIPAATSVAEISAFLDRTPGLPGRTRARQAIPYLVDHAFSAPEAVLSTAFGLPPREQGYGLGPITLNRAVAIAENENSTRGNTRYPDILLPFAPIGVNYDGEGHLDLAGLARAAREAAEAEADTKQQAENALAGKIAEVREKAVDDIRRNRQLAAAGYIVFPATKEDLLEYGALDELARQILGCARTVFGVDTQAFEETLDDSARARERYELLVTLVPVGAASQASNIL